MFKHQMTPLTKGGKTQVHAGKGARSSSLRPQGNNPAPAGSAAPPPNVQGPNNYAKAVPPATPPATPSAPDGGLGSGNWPGIGQ